MILVLDFILVAICAVYHHVITEASMSCGLEIQISTDVKKCQISLQIQTEIFCGKSAKGLSGKLTSRNEMGSASAGRPNLRIELRYSKPCSCFSYTDAS